ncbi:hypothetical protein K438DRAFT_1990487 [Mycena galopus ATCC 62051]|nr:hypothetical protein K438DRAFT_1990487 [Mycena galopus ATCC 62051]
MSLQQSTLCFHKIVYVEPCALKRLHYTLNPNCMFDGEGYDEDEDEDEEVQPKLRIIQGPHSMIIGDLKGPHMLSEKTARMRLIGKQRSELEQAGSWACVLSHIAILEDVAEAGQLDQQWRCMEAGKISTWAPPAPTTSGVRSMVMSAACALTRSRTPSNCFADIALAMSAFGCGWKHHEAAAIAKRHPGWDKSTVSYSWVGLTFPHTYNRDDIERELAKTLGL